MCKTSSSCKLACNSWALACMGIRTARRCRRCLKSMITGKFVINLWDNGNERYPSWHGCVVSVCNVGWAVQCSWSSSKHGFTYMYSVEIPLCFMYMSNMPSARHYIVCRVQSVFVWAPACRVCALAIHTERPALLSLKSHCG